MQRRNDRARAKTTAIASALIIWAAHLPAILAAEKTYYNRCIGLTIPIPDGWRALDDKEIRNALAMVPAFLNLRGADPEPATKQLPQSVVLALVPDSCTAGPTNVDSSLLFFAMNVLGQPDEVHNPDFFLNQISQAVKEMSSTWSVDEVSSMNLGGTVFRVLDVQGSLDSVHFQQRLAATVTNEYLVGIVMTAGDPMGMFNMGMAVASITLCPVPPSMEGIPECARLRRVTSASAPNPRTQSLRNMGLVLLVVAGFVLIRGILYRR